ncbi:uncharacterized protein F5891DRAFT_1258106 [Suillus fuscotomentosus]|uniref:Uncharacterized protein n=1 Tax=Suillus fuscotomentosus TaxID=1912939 RepID=A0AAD4EEL9_9AGAM|nr:uncharacterized protein F5891DRAFT_1258106 [Suillus fuscotomentosus]KAG1904824.1 hypothetical protein F5891DRAFT_1258106 [Suillus fuscotomentosus]
MACQYRPHGDSDWISLLTKDPQCPIPSTWVVKLSCTFVGDLRDTISCTGIIINSAYGLSWDMDVLMFEHFKVPIWVYWPSTIQQKLLQQLRLWATWRSMISGASSWDRALSQTIYGVLSQTIHENKEKEMKETPSQYTIQVFEWQADDDDDDDDDDEDGFLLHYPVMKACIEGIWRDYNKDTRIFDSFSNYDNQEDEDNIMPLLPITAPSELPSPTPSSFSEDIYKYFGNEVSLALRHASIEAQLKPTTGSAMLSHRNPEGNQAYPHEVLPTTSTCGSAKPLDSNKEVLLEDVYASVKQEDLPHIMLDYQMSCQCLGKCILDIKEFLDIYKHNQCTLSYYLTMMVHHHHHLDVDSTMTKATKKNLKKDLSAAKKPNGRATPKKLDKKKKKKYQDRVALIKTAKACAVASPIVGTSVTGTLDEIPTLF